MAITESFNPGIGDIVELTGTSMKGIFNPFQFREEGATYSTIGYVTEKNQKAYWLSEQDPKHNNTWTGPLTRKCKQKNLDDGQILTGEIVQAPDDANGLEDVLKRNNGDAVAVGDAVELRSEKHNVVGYVAQISATKVKLAPIDPYLSPNIIWDSTTTYKLKDFNAFKHLRERIPPIMMHAEPETPAPEDPETPAPEGTE